MGRVKAIPEVAETLGGGRGPSGVSSPNVRPGSFFSRPTVIVGDVFDGREGGWEETPDRDSDTQMEVVSAGTRFG
jgi:hypothetical protein